MLQLVNDYEARIEQLERMLDGSSQEQPSHVETKQLRTEIHNLNGLLREQESVMVELLHRNNHLEETVLQLQGRQLLNSDSPTHNELEDSDLS